MKLFIALLTCFIYHSLFSQGIEFDSLQGKGNLGSVFSIARNTGKNVFVDCFATWCSPCKIMEQRIFVEKDLGEYMNNKFVCIRIQMDSTDHDSKITRQLYEVVNNFRHNYNISAFPTLLFLSPDGELMYKSVGFRNSKELLEVAKKIEDSTQNYSLLQSCFYAGDRSFPILKKLAIASLDAGDTLLLATVNEHLFKTNFPISKDIIIYLNKIVNSSSQAGFKVVQKNKSLIDSLMGGRYAEEKIKQIIHREEIAPHLKDSVTEEKWRSISQSVTNKYASLGDEALKFAKVTFYYNKRQWNKFSKAYYDFFSRYGDYFLNAMYLNNFSWKIFLYCTDERILKEAVRFSYKAMQIEPKAADYIDTHANLLYKLGEVKEAIEWEKKAIEADPNYKDARESLRLMQLSQKTWGIQ